MRIFKSLLVVALLSSFNLTSTSLSAQTSNKIEQSKEHVVYITKTGAKYHRGSCRYLSQSKIETTLSDATSEGYTPCKVCKPTSTSSSSTKTSKTYSDGRCTATTQKGTRCKRSVSSGSSTCWQH